MSASTFQNLGLSVSVYKPKIEPLQGEYYPYDTIYDDNVSASIESYSHTITSERGFEHATIALRLSAVEAEKWFEESIGYSVLVVDESYNTVFEGFINSVNLSYGTFTAIRGPLVDIANRVIVEYTPIDFRVDPFVEGVTIETLAAEDSDSQEKYGIFEVILSAGKIGLFNTDPNDNDAVRIRDAYLRENKSPQTSDVSVNISTETGYVDVVLECEGFGRFLEVYVYNNYGSLSTIISDKMKAIITADPNGIISRNFSQLETNLFLVAEGVTANSIAYNALKELLPYGNDTTEDRRTFGIYEDRIVHYKQIPTNPEYFHNVRSDVPFIENDSQDQISPWLIRPAKWLHLSGLLSTRAYDALNLRNDPRNVFIETVTYSTPFNLNVNGMKLSTIAQMLAKYGLDGISA